MLDLYEEFATLIGALEAAGADYAVCGGLAMAIHGFPRATIDVDRPMKVDMSPAAVTLRLKQVSQLRRLWLALGKAKVVPVPPTREPKLDAKS